MLKNLQSLKRINDIKDLDFGQNLYVYRSDNPSQLDKLKNEYGEENILNWADFETDLPNPQFYSKEPITQKRLKVLSVHRARVRLLILEQDFSELTMGDVISRINEFSAPYLGGNVINQGFQFTFYFVKCRFSTINYEKNITNVFKNNGKEIKILNSEINKVEVDEFDIPTIKDCVIDTLVQNKRGHDKTFFLRNNTVENFIIACNKLDLKNSTIFLFHSSDLENLWIKIDNVKILFNLSLVKNLSKDQHAGYWNTFHALKNIKSLNSEQSEIEKYLHFFDSRKHWFKRWLFTFNQGYTAWKIPGFVTILALLLNVAILDNWLNYTGDTLTTVFYPVSLFKDVIFKDFNLSFFQNISWPKLIMLLIEIVFIYASFSFGMAIKKIFGFKISN